jgi:TetR/AcrR family transcriptional regulator, lmrAB and yxaGH operons repressor
MANSKVSRQDVLKDALELFRAAGFKGVSLKDISRKTGLEKPSLYFKFPGGKEEIALMALDEAIRYFSVRVFGALNRPGSPREKIHLAMEGLRQFYADGTKPCFTDSLSFPNGCPDVSQALNQFAHAWLDAFRRVAEEDGIAEEEARARAERAVIVLQGSLVLSRVIQDPSPFRRALIKIPDVLLKGN